MQIFSNWEYDQKIVYDGFTWTGNNWEDIGPEAELKNSIRETWKTIRLDDDCKMPEVETAKELYAALLKCLHVSRPNPSLLHYYSANPLTPKAAGTMLMTQRMFKYMRAFAADVLADPDVCALLEVNRDDGEEAEYRTFNRYIIDSLKALKAYTQYRRTGFTLIPDNYTEEDIGRGFIGLIPSEPIPVRDIRERMKKAINDIWDISGILEARGVTAYSDELGNAFELNEAKREILKRIMG